jgi:translation elongation factor EF-Ts
MHGGVRAALVELNCETDFVARAMHSSESESGLVADVAHTAAFLAEAGSSTTRRPTGRAVTRAQELLLRKKQ